MKLEFYHWGFQCPVIYETLDLLKGYSNELEIEIVDISLDTVHGTSENTAENIGICKSQRVFFPFLTVFNGEQRWFRPLDAITIESFISGKELVEQPYRKTWSTDIYHRQTTLLNEGNVSLLKAKCTLSDCGQSCGAKGEFLKRMGCEFWGVLHLDGENVVGGAEYVPSLLVPYDIPKSDDVAFLTCLYPSSEAFDYKSVPLERLEAELRSKYTSLIAITDVYGSFPNGDLQWFMARGYEDLGVVSVEEGYCTLHLVRKFLK